MEFIEYAKLCLTKKYAQFNGRSRRKEYWSYVLVLGVVSMVLELIGRLSGSLSVMSTTSTIMGIIGLATLVPSIAVTIRRLHDTGRSGWFILISLIPLVGGIILLIFLCTDSKPDNQYGPNPKTIAN